METHFIYDPTARLIYKLRETHLAVVTRIILLLLTSEHAAKLSTRNKLSRK